MTVLARCAEFGVAVLIVIEDKIPKRAKRSAL